MNIIEFGDCRDIMRRWAMFGFKAQTCITSPPYWGLRDYGHGGQLGLEKTPVEYVANMVEVFRLVRDLLADDGVLWLNLGDSYATGAGAVGNAPGGGAQGDAWKGHRGSRGGSAKQPHTGNAIGPMTQPNRMPIAGLKAKDLCGIPWRVAFALQADGWYLRQDIIWHKPNPMPESVTDRCTKAHEYLFLLVKSERYFFDSAAMQEPVAASTVARLSQVNLENQTGSDRVPGKTNGNMKAVGNTETRNRRSVWTVNTKPYKGAHFATFPPALIEPCILAGSRPGDIVLDPFMGSGTTAMVAKQHGRQYLGCELNTEYGALQQERLA